MAEPVAPWRVRTSITSRATAGTTPSDNCRLGSSTAARTVKPACADVSRTKATSRNVIINDEMMLFDEIFVIF